MAKKDSGNMKTRKEKNIGRGRRKR